MSRVSYFLIAATLAIAHGCDGCCELTNDCPPDIPAAYDPEVCLWVRPDPDSADCPDEYEPNQDMTQAYASATERECAGTRSGIISSRDDVDVFRTGKCGAGIDVPIIGSYDRTLEPQVNVISAEDGVRVCIVPLCTAGSSNVYSCWEESSGNTKTSFAPTRTHSYFRGCCRTGPGIVGAVMHCPMHHAELDTFFWVDAGEESPVCASYELSWSID